MDNPEPESSMVGVEGSGDEERVFGCSELTVGVVPGRWTLRP